MKESRIKFRAKSRRTGEWIYGDLMHAGTSPNDDEYEILYWDEESGWMQDKIIPDTVCQFTGLHDKEGQEIYVEDIIELGLGRHKVQYIITPTTFTAITYMAHSCKDGDSVELWQIETETKYIKVIGNYYDNPELRFNKKD